LQELLRIVRKRVTRFRGSEQLADPHARPGRSFEPRSFGRRDRGARGPDGKNGVARKWRRNDLKRFNPRPEMVWFRKLDPQDLGTQAGTADHARSRLGAAGMAKFVTPRNFQAAPPFALQIRGSIGLHENSPPRNPLKTNDPGKYTVADCKSRPPLRRAEPFRPRQA